MTISKCEASIMIFIDFPCEHCDFGIPDGEILVCILLQNIYKASSNILQLVLFQMNLWMQVLLEHDVL